MKNDSIKEKQEFENVKHFGIWINNKRKYLKINRDEHAEIDNKNHSLSDEYCIKQQERCLINYDLNMRFFSKIKYEDFEKVIKKLKKKFKKLVETTDLSIYGKKEGIYILILDDYKQMYVGQTSDIKKKSFTTLEK